MNDNAVNPTNETPQRWCGRSIAILLVLLALLFAAATAVGTSGILTTDGDSIFPPIGLTAVAPVVLFLVAFALSASLRRFLLAQDMRLLTALQLWRVVGFAFLMVYAFGVLPAFFALPAGIGDVAVGLAAAYVLARLNRDLDYARSGGFLLFQFMGMLDFIVAIVTGSLTAGALPGLVPDGITSAPMEVWPLNLFPSFLVPLFIILHLIALFKIVQMRRGGSVVATVAA